MRDEAGAWRIFKDPCLVHWLGWEKWNPFACSRSVRLRWEWPASGSITVTDTNSHGSAALPAFGFLSAARVRERVALIITDRPVGGGGKGEREEQSNKFFLFFFFWGPVRFKWAEIAIYDRHVCVAAAVIDSTRRKKKILLKLHSVCLFIYIRWVVFFERKRENGAKGWPVNWPLSPI